jgi:menaquinone-dependent protoporphyrinogen oxidase
VRVLVAHGSERGGTAELAEWIATGLREGGASPVIVPCAEVDDLAGHGAVVIGGSLYAGRWHPDARRFVRRHQIALSRLPVWLFSSGPLGDVDAARLGGPVGDVEEALARTDAREHVLFGGRLAPDARGFVARRLARSRAGDWRDADEARAWGAGIARVLALSEPQPT